MLELMPNGSPLINKIADSISRLKKSHTSTSTSFHYDFSKLEQDHADLKHCCFYHPSQELLSLIWENCVGAKIAKLRLSSSLETERFRQAKYLNWCQVKKITNPCRKEHGYEQILACFGRNLIMECHSKSATVTNYALAVNKLFEMRKYPIPADLVDKTNMMSKIIHAREREENIARQQSPLTKEMYVKMAKRAKISPQDSVDSVLFDFFNLIRVGGFRVTEYAQTTQTKIDEFEYGSGNKVVKAFVPTDWSFYDASGRLMTLHSLDGSGDPPKKLKIEFRIQKNRQNRQLITFTADENIITFA
jgi:hypothetical protein